MSLSNPALARSEACTAGVGRRCRRLAPPPRKRMDRLAAASSEIRRTA
jgi:hypothetical protein